MKCSRVANRTNGNSVTSDAILADSGPHSFGLAVASAKDVSRELTGSVHCLCLQKLTADENRGRIHYSSLRLRARADWQIRALC